MAYFWHILSTITPGEMIIIALLLYAIIKG